MLLKTTPNKHSAWHLPKFHCPTTSYFRYAKYGARNSPFSLLLVWLPSNAIPNIIFVPLFRMGGFAQPHLAWWIAKFVRLCHMFISFEYDILRINDKIVCFHYFLSGYCAQCLVYFSFCALSREISLR